MRSNMNIKDLLKEDSIILNSNAKVKLLFKEV